MTVHWHDDECGWCPCDEPDATEGRTPSPGDLSPGDLSWGGREQWRPGDRAHFEYHCWESHDSADAQAWYRSHRQVTVLRENEDDSPRADMPTHAERAEEGMPVTYQIRHDDGFEHTAFEDELLRGPEFFERPNPPSAPARTPS